MAHHCTICDTRRPVGDTKMLVLNGGSLWVEFCPKCEDTLVRNGETGEEITIGELYNRAGEKANA